MKSLLTAALIVGTCAGAASADDQISMLGRYHDWSAISYTPDGGPVQCAMTASGRNGTLVNIHADPETVDAGFLVVQFVNKGWHLATRDSVIVRVDLDYRQWSLDATTEGSSMSGIVSEGDAIAGFRDGSAMAIYSEQDRIVDTVSLRGSAAAMNRMAECLQSFSSDPFGSRAAVEPGAEVTNVATTSAEGVTWGTETADPNYAFINVVGELTEETIDAFNAVAEKVGATYGDQVTVRFTSPGGLIFAGMILGEEIHDRGWITFVPAGGGCYSACAVAWLGGVELWVTTTSSVGFHQAYDLDDHKASVEANAMIGSYVANLGYGYSTTVLMTEAGPDDMVELTPERAEEAGLTVNVWK